MEREGGREGGRMSCLLIQCLMLKLSCVGGNDGGRKRGEEGRGQVTEEGDKYRE